MTLLDLLLLLPLLLAVSLVVGTAGHERGEIARAVRKTFFGLLVAVVVIGVVVRLIVELFA